MNLSKSNSSRIRQIAEHPGEFEADILSRYINEARFIGPCTVEMSKLLWYNHIYEAESALHSFLRLSHPFSEERLEDACRRVLFYRIDSPMIVKTVLKQNLDLLPLDRKTDVYGQYKLF